MTIFRRLVSALAILGLLAFGSPSRADQTTLTTPGAPLTMANLATFLNNAHATIATNFSGATAPTVCAGSTICTYQLWLDTSTTPRTLRIYDGASWVAIGTLDTSGHVFSLGTGAASSLAINGCTLGSDKFCVTGSAAISGVVSMPTGISTGNIGVLTGAILGFGSGTKAIVGPGSADGQIKLTDSAQTSFTSLLLGPQTASFPSLKRNGTAVNFRLADDSAAAPITAASLTLNGCTLGANAFCVAGTTNFEGLVTTSPGVDINGGGAGTFGGALSGAGSVTLGTNAGATTVSVLPNTAIAAGGTTGIGLKLSSTANFGLFPGSGAPSLTGAQGSLYLRSDGGVGTRAYVNTNGTTGYVALADVNVTTLSSLVSVGTLTGGATGAGFTVAFGSSTLTGQVPLANGGTAANLTASNGGIFYSTGSAGAILSGTATANQMLQSGASTTPAWSTTTWPATTTANRILYSSATSVVGQITSGNNGVLVTDGSGVPSISSTIPNATQDLITRTGTLVSGATGSGFTLALGSSTITGSVPLANGGAGGSLTASNGGIVYSDATRLQLLAGTVTASQCLLSGSNAAPTWGSCAGGAAVASVTAADATLTISPTTGAVVAGINLANANAWTAAQTIQSTSATAFAVGRNGATNPAFLVDDATASSATGVKIKSAAAAGGVAVSVITSGTNENLTIDAAGSGTITLGGTSTGAIILNRATTITTPTFTGTVTGAVTSVTCGTALTGGAITTAGTCAVDVASAAQMWAATASKIPDAAIVASAGALTALTDAATIAVDMALGVNYSVTLAGNRTLGAPTNTQVGRTGCIFFTQDGTGSRTLAYNAVWHFAGGTDPVASTTAAAVDMLCYIVRTSTSIIATLTKDVK